MQNANYRKLNDRSLNSSKYHKLDGTAIRAKLKMEHLKEINEYCWGIKDRFHPYINGDNQPEIRSDNSNFKSEKDFFIWCQQHGAKLNEIYVIIK